MQSLRTLDFGGNQCGGNRVDELKWCEVLALVISKTSRLEHLSLSGNNFGAEGTHILIELLDIMNKGSSNIRCINLEGCGFQNTPTLTLTSSFTVCHLRGDSYFVCPHIWVRHLAFSHHHV